MIGKIAAGKVPRAENSKEVPEEITFIVNRALVYESEKKIKLEEILELFQKPKKR